MSSSFFDPNNRYTPEEFARAIFPGCIMVEVETNENHGPKASYDSCVNQINNQLSFYAFSQVGPWESWNLKKIKDINKSFAPGHSRREVPSVGVPNRTHKLYCLRCLKSGSTMDEHYAEVVAIAKFSRVTEEDKVFMSAEVLSLYPHCQACTQQLEFRCNYLMDKENGGSGYSILPFATNELLFQCCQLDYGDSLSDDIMADISKSHQCWSPYELLVSHLLQEGIRGNHGGTQIVNSTKSYDGDYPYDLRYYIKVGKIAEFLHQIYNLNREEFAARHKMLQLRIALWFANVMNLASEVCDYDTDLTIGNYDSAKFGEKKQPHLQLVLPTILYGGKQGDAAKDEANDYHQPIHCDFCCTNDGHPVSTNPRLNGLGKPGSLVIPLTPKGRCVYIGGRVIHVPFKKALFFVGDCEHAGATISSSTYSDNDCQPALHIYVVSDHHQVDVEDFELVEEKIGLLQPHLLHLLSPSSAADQCEAIANKFSIACKSALKIPNGDTKRIASLLDGLMESLPPKLKSEMKQDVNPVNQSNEFSLNAYNLRSRKESNKNSLESNKNSNKKSQISKKRQHSS